MDRFQNVKMVASPSSSQAFDPKGSSAYAKKESTRYFYESGVRAERRSSAFQDLALAKSGFYNSSTLQESTVKTGISRGIGNLPDDRIRKIAKDFVQLYGLNGEIASNGLFRIQKQAYQKCSQKPEFNQESVKQLQKVMDQNMDSRVTEDDVVSLCRRYLNCDKRPITYTPVVLERLAVARRLFQQFDVEKKGYLTEKQVPNLLNQTYRTLGRTFNATEEDIKSWMKLADGDGDGHVTIDQYERSIIRALKKQGIKIYEQ